MGDIKYWTTAKVLCFEEATRVLLILPFSGKIIKIWSFVIETIGLSVAHKTTKANAFFLHSVIMVY